MPLQLNGTNDYVQINNQVYSLGGGSICVWVKGFNYNTYLPFGSYGGASEQRAPGCYTSVAGILQWEFGSIGATTRNTPITIPLGVWHHICITYNAAFLSTIYYNGVAVDSATASSPVSLFNQVHFGHYGNFGSFFHLGFISDVYIYNRALTAQEVSTIYSSRTMGVKIQDGLLGYWPLDDGRDGSSLITLGRANDRSKNGLFHGVAAAGAAGLIYRPNDLLSYP